MCCWSIIVGWFKVLTFSEVRRVDMHSRFPSHAKIGTWAAAAVSGMHKLLSLHWRKPFLPSTTIFTSSGQSCMLWHSSIWLLAVFCLRYICYLIWQAQKRVIAFLTCNFNSVIVLDQIHRFDLCLFCCFASNNLHIPSWHVAPLLFYSAWAF